MVPVDLYQACTNNVDMDSPQPDNEQIPSPSARPSSLLLFIIVLVLAGAACAGYYVLSVKELTYPSSSIRPETVITAPVPSESTHLNPTVPAIRTPFESVFTYTLPPGYKKDEDNSNDGVVFFRSPGAKVEGYNMLLEGATIAVVSRSNPQHLPLKEYIDGVMDTLENDRYDYPELTIAGLPALNAFICYEGCQDIYYVEHEGYVWEISMRCMDSCGTKKEIDGTEYGKHRDAFLSSLRLR